MDWNKRVTQDLETEKMFYKTAKNVLTKVLFGAILSKHQSGGPVARPEIKKVFSEKKFFLDKANAKCYYNKAAAERRKRKMHLEN